MESLRWKYGELEGIPYYDYSDRLPGEKQIVYDAGSGSHQGWLNLPIIKVLDTSMANKAAHDHLVNGADGVLFDCSKRELPSWHELLQGIEWNYCMVSFILPANNEQFIPSLADYIVQRRFASSSLRGFFTYDTYPHDPQNLHKVVHSLMAYGNLCTVGIQTQALNPVDEVSDLLADAVRVADQLINQAHEASVILPKIFFTVQTSTDFFIDIARLKALRWLWFQIVRAYGVNNFNPSDVYIHTHSVSWRQTAYEPHENMLKGTTASIAAILGGSSSLTTHPAEEEDSQLCRIARNVSNLLREESHLARVADATAGAWYVDALTNELSSKAWDAFKQKLAKL